jgi:hypothetical protein
VAWFEKMQGEIESYGMKAGDDTPQCQEMEMKAEQEKQPSKQTNPSEHMLPHLWSP